MKHIDADKLTKAIEDKGLDCSFVLKMERLDTLALIDELRVSEDKRRAEELIKALQSGYYDGYQHGKEDAQKEQKPKKEWSEEDERIRKWLLECVENLSDGNFIEVSRQDVLFYLEKQKEKPNIEICPHSVKSKSYKEKPAECIEDSIEFEEGFKTGRETGLRDGQKYVLDNLESYGLCKSAEWSEEDERKLQDCINIVGRWEGDYDIAYAPYSNFLKSLRPSWKPSEHQMSMLLAVINDSKNAYSASCHLSLKSLYNDLKKL